MSSIARHLAPYATAAHSHHTMSSTMQPQSDFIERERVRAAIAERRGGVVSPFFEALLERPAIAGAASDMGAAIRFSGCLPPALRELAICTVAAHWKAEYEWTVHSALAAKEGLSRDLLDAVRSQQPLPDADATQSAVHTFLVDLLRHGRAPAASRQQVLDILDRSQVVELAAIAGYFSLLSFVINTFA